MKIEVLYRLAQRGYAAGTLAAAGDGVTFAHCLTDTLADELTRFVC
jgi:hypothetical protein